MKSVPLDFLDEISKVLQGLFGVQILHVVNFEGIGPER